MGSTLGDLGEFADLLRVCERGLIRPVIDRRYGLDDAHAALDRLESGAQFGKLAIEIS
jgi:NADPH:quinone reductase-like Zn-dependent oxidoreductase